MNLSPEWIPVFSRHGHEALHWSEVGDARAQDVEIMAWASQNQFVVFTNDLDFGSILASSQARTPSVLQVRAQDVSPVHLEGIVMAALSQYAEILTQGAIVVVDEARLRSRILPIRR